MKRWKFRLLKSNYLSKSNLNYINCKNYEGIILLTWLTWRLGFKSRGLKSISLVSSLMCIRHSMGDSDQFSQRFVINPTSIWWHMSLECRDHEEVNILLQKCLISSHFNQNLSLQGGRTAIYRKIIAINAVRPIRWRRLDGWDGAKSVGHDPMTGIPLTLDFGRAIFIGLSLWSQLSLYD